MSSPSPQAALDLRQYARPVWARRWPILAVIMLVSVATYVYYDRKPDRFAAQSTIFIQSSELEQSLFGVLSFSDSDRTTANQARLLLTEAVAREVAQDIGFQGDPRALLASISTDPAPDSDFITIKAVGSTPIEAAKLANGFANAFIALRSQAARGKVRRALAGAREELDRLPRTVSNQDARDAARSQIRRLQIGLGLPSGTAEVAERAVPSPGPFEPKPAKNTIFAFALSLVFAILAALGLERLDRRVRDVNELETVFQYPVLAVLPHVDKLVGFTGECAVVPHRLREPSRSLRLNVDLGSSERSARTLLVTSALSVEGKSTVVRNLAITYAEAGRNVVVLDADLRRPSQASYFRVEARPGLTDVLADEVSLRDAEQRVQLEAEGTGLSVVTAGPQPANPPAVLGGGQMRDVLAQLTERFDVVIIDSPPLLVVSDAIPLLSEVDGVLLVARMTCTTRDASRKLVTTLQRVPDINVLGVVANDEESEDRPDYYMYYGQTPMATSASSREANPVSET